MAHDSSCSGVRTEVEATREYPVVERNGRQVTICIETVTVTNYGSTCGVLI